MYDVKEINRIKKLVDINSNKYSSIIMQMYYQTEHKHEFAFAILPDDMTGDDRINLLKWYMCFGDERYEYSLSERSIIGKFIN